MLGRAVELHRRLERLIPTRHRGLLRLSHQGRELRLGKRLERPGSFEGLVEENSSTKTPYSVALQHSWG